MAIKAKLTTFDTTMIVVSLVIGIGIFRTPAIVAKATHKPVLFFAAWSLGGLISLLGALTFAEIGSRFPRPGSFYKVVAESYGSLPAFMLNWTSVLIVNGAGAAAVAIIGAEYLNPIILPQRLQSQLAVQLSAAGLMLILLVINYLGIKTGAWAQNILTLIKIGMIALLVFAAFRHHGFPAAASLPAAGESSNPWWLALAIGLISVFYTYGGYQCTINFGADVQKAQRNMPRAILIGVLIIIACYLSINFAYFKVLGVQGIAEAKLVAAEVARVCFGSFGYLFVSLAIFLSATGFLNVTLMQIPRAYYAMAEDRTLPQVFKKVNPRTQTQEFALLFFGAIILLSISLLSTFENIVNYVMFLDSMNIAVVASTIFVLRRKAKLSGQPYSGARAPLYPVLPAFFVLFLMGISVNVLLTQTKQALMGAVFLVTGLPVFFLMRWINKSPRPAAPQPPAQA
ncbi:MAG: amino acid permease [Candidatus Aminicenantes bacterium]|nr:amino acid permease [Candidatus Aminicenantes bacterium]